MSNTKTIREWLETLPEPHRTQALDNTLKLNGVHGREVLNFPLKEVEDPLAAAFIWENSPEGHDYWENFYNSR